MTYYLTLNCNITHFLQAVLCHIEVRHSFKKLSYYLKSFNGHNGHEPPATIVENAQYLEEE